MHEKTTRANCGNQRNQQAVWHETKRETRVCAKSSTILCRTGNVYRRVAWQGWQAWTWLGRWRSDLFRASYVWASMCIDAGLLLDDLMVCLSYVGFVLNTNETTVITPEAQPPPYLSISWNKKVLIKNNVINGLAACWASPQWWTDDTTLISIL